MKKMHLVLLIIIAATIAGLLIYMGDVTTYETISSARKKTGKAVMVIAKLDVASLQYDALKNPNYLTFEAVDTLGDRMKVAYYYEKPYDMEKSERVVLKGKMENGVFEIRKKDGILVKCPSKYKDDMEAAKKNLQANIK
ncbi:MAG TPA: cytochrome c maturation protein CcmE [Chitinophagaceae bacterium]|jgi:cytochrome c-type biogenesis protein CcmE|nr:cytochrome c maturation protein CcmE [Chitinophagaceae bacterium]